MQAPTVDVVWGLNGMLAAAGASSVVIVDVLSFSTSLDAACSRGARVYPFGWHEDGVHDFAAAVNAEVAARRPEGGGAAPSLSPPTLLNLTPGSRLVLPSPNGSALSADSPAARTLAACLRNAASVARYVNATERRAVTIVAAGERWPDGSLRVAHEDQIGAGAVAAHLAGRKSEEALAAQAVFAAAVGRLEHVLLDTASGRELRDRGYARDVTFASALNCSATVPVLRDGAYVAA